MRTKMWTVAVAAALVAVVGLVGLAWAQNAAAPAAPAPAAKNPVVVMKTSMGTLKIELWPDKAPETVKQFLAMADSKFYEGTLIHRSWTDRVLQGGQYKKDWSRVNGPGTLKNEAKADVQNMRGTIAMSTHEGKPDDGNNQFIINLADNHMFDHKDETPKGFGKCVFGKIIDGMDAADKMGKVETESKEGHNEVPKEPIVIESVTLEAAK